MDYIRCAVEGWNVSAPVLVSQSVTLGFLGYSLTRWTRWSLIVTALVVLNPHTVGFLRMSIRTDSIWLTVFPLVRTGTLAACVAIGMCSPPLRNRVARMLNTAIMGFVTFHVLLMHFSFLGLTVPH